MKTKGGQRKTGIQRKKNFDNSALMGHGDLGEELSAIMCGV